MAREHESSEKVKQTKPNPLLRKMWLTYVDFLQKIAANNKQQKPNNKTGTTYILCIFHIAKNTKKQTKQSKYTKPWWYNVKPEWNSNCEGWDVLDGWMEGSLHT